MTPVSEQAADCSYLVSPLSGPAGQPIVDKTGLTVTVPCDVE